MRKLMSTNKSQIAKGFTIIELLIATAVFSTVLLLALTGFLQIGKIFYKGINATQTNSVARQVLDNLKNDITYSSDTSPITFANGNGGSGRTYFCTGSNRYSFILGQELDTTAEAGQRATSGPQSKPPYQWDKFGLLKDTVSTPNSCPNPFVAGTSQMSSTAQELLNDKMRVSMLKVTQLGAGPLEDFTKLYNLDIKMVYGDDDILINANTPAATCTDSNHSSFCFTTELQTTVRKGF